MIISEWFYINKYTKIRRVGDMILINEKNCNNQTNIIQINIETVKELCDISKILINIKDVECEYESDFVDEEVKE